MTELPAEIQAVAAELESSLEQPGFPGSIPQLCGRLEQLLPHLAENPLLLPYSVEIHKQLRLIGSDLSFWQVARQAQGRSQRQDQISQRLKLLFGYCESMIEQLSPPQ
ncbi:MAG: heterocyst frequency control protein PatD [Pseudanabaenaceae cyanobacterium bins.68]|nr:heterocyst frequency control protein PatD [Pseudanabaenaceae cyanobacterium bins.68]